MSFVVMTSNNSAASRNGATDMDLEKDTRPEHSPYASEPCAVSFGDGKSLHIPRELLCQVGQIMIPGHKPCLNQMSSETGHVLIHFLTCGVYQCLRPQGDSLEERRVSEFRTAIDVYAAAESLQLPRLRDLARQEFTRLGDNLTLPSIISAIEDSGRSLKTLPGGVVAYVESRIHSFGEGATPEGVDEMLLELGRPDTLSRTLLKAMLLLKSSELSKERQKFHEKGGQRFYETATSVSEEEMMEKRISPAEQAMKQAEAKPGAMADFMAKFIAKKAAEEETIRAAKVEEADAAAEAIAKHEAKEAQMLAEFMAKARARKAADGGAIRLAKAGEAEAKPEAAAKHEAKETQTLAEFMAEFIAKKAAEEEAKKAANAEEVDANLKAITKHEAKEAQMLAEFMAKARARKAADGAIRPAKAGEAEAKPRVITNHEAMEAQMLADFMVKARARKAADDKAVPAAIGEEACLKEAFELQTLRNKKYTRGGKLLRRDQNRLDELAKRSERRTEARRSYKPIPMAPVVTSEEHVTVDTSFTFPAMAVTPTSEEFEVLNVEMEAQDAKALETPSSRSSDTWSL